MHTLITGWARVDHADGDGLNNQRSNLREATSAQNAANSRPRTGGTSAFKGVCWVGGRRQCWTAQIRINRGTRFLGYFSDEVAAARAYDAAAVAAWGPFARLNFPA